MRLANPLSQDHALIRPSLLMGLLQAIRRNVSRGRFDLRCFEVGGVVRDGNPPTEETSLGIALSGRWTTDWRGGCLCDFWVLKGVVEALAEKLNAQDQRWADSELSWADPSQAATIIASDQTRLGAAGKVADHVLRAFGVETEVWYAELSLSPLARRRGISTNVRPSPLFPPVKRDLSFIVSEAVSFEAVASAIRSTAGAQADLVELIDRFVGGQLPPGTYSLTFSLEYRHGTRTLTAGEADALHERVRHMLQERFSAQLR